MLPGLWGHQTWGAVCSSPILSAHGILLSHGQPCLLPLQTGAGPCWGFSPPSSRRLDDPRLHTVTGSWAEKDTPLFLRAGLAIWDATQASRHPSPLGAAQVWGGLYVLGVREGEGHELLLGTGVTGPLGLLWGPSHPTAPRPFSLLPWQVLPAFSRPRDSGAGATPGSSVQGRVSMAGRCREHSVVCGGG